MDRVQALGTSLIAVGGAMLAREALSRIADRQRGRLSTRPPAPAPQRRETPALAFPPVVAAQAGRRLNASAAILAGSVLLDSSVEHYRGLFRNRAMYVPLGVSAATLAASAFGAADTRPGAHGVRHAIYAAAGVTGLAGFSFHAYNILKRPGRLSWLNLFYAAPIGAPWALTLAGALGLIAERLRDARERERPSLLGLPAGRAAAGLTSIGIAGTVAEAALLHFRGAFQNPAMYIPVTLPPIAAALLAEQALRREPVRPRLARAWLRLTALVGALGVAFHVYGVSRAMGGWRNWSQNLIDGPPIPAPPSFTGLALAGLAAMRLIEEDARG